MKFLKKLILTLLILIIVLISILFIIGYSTYASALKQKPLVDRVTEVTSKENFVKFSEMSDIYRNAVVAVEDHRFYDHGPVDFIAICRAFYINLKTKELQEGGSTITQQVAKNIVFSQEQSYDLEKNYTKNQIFEIYVNTAYFGDGFYGIYDASHGYYDKDPKDLNLDESSMLAGVPNAPSLYSPNVNLTLAKKRQAHVIKKMQEYGYITQEQALPFLSYSY